MLRARTPSALGVGVLVLLSSASAWARPEVVTWSHDSPCKVEGFELRVGPSANDISETIDVGRPRQAGGHFSYVLEVPDEQEVYICVAAHRDGLMSECSNQLHLAPSTPGTTRSVPAPMANSLAWCEDFNQRSSPAWIHTGPNSSLTPAPSLFNVQNVGGENYALSTAVEQPDVHSHLIAPGVQLWSAYEYSGQMRFAEDEAGIGVTFYSRFNSMTGYYRLGRGARGNFELIRATSFHCDPATEMPAMPNVWFAFRVRVQDKGVHALLESKVWRADEREPEGFQWICTNSDPGRLTSGTIGVWSAGAGQKWWDNLSVSRLDPESDDDPLGVPGKPELAP